EVNLTYKDEKFSVEGSYHQDIPIHEISNPTLTMRRDFAFFYQDRNYLFKLEHKAIAFLRIAQDKY
ncbi:MAG TPA: hypothetical protein DHV05_05740, partial [Acholeplasmataceae bacterium]|nr:hypothetical protein [Acholeplasmataceae bacterium]